MIAPTLAEMDIVLKEFRDKGIAEYALHPETRDERWGFTQWFRDEWMRATFQVCRDRKLTIEEIRAKRDVLLEDGMLVAMFRSYGPSYFTIPEIAIRLNLCMVIARLTSEAWAREGRKSQ